MGWEADSPFQGADESREESSLTWREREREERASLRGQEAGREKECTGETEPGSRKIWAAKNYGLNVTR